ncbi:MAG: PKD domain-containing protein, partial [Bacteroidota bacterium]|nr:PKD domain-containing protein [Bacteroidota bacterium]MDX5431514.1 PKD domain-containing protein [Bacteroidota bacterium]MDX5470238.1 PKD domain-containing protein [Bacteroidota bacterium]
YEIPAPTGYTNADYGTDWTITDISFKTPGGNGPATSDTMTSMPGSGNAMITYIPSTGVDTVYLVSVTVMDLNTMCDTLVERYLIVGADPNAQFSSPSICEGDITNFNNMSRIASGFMTFKWYFGDGDSSDVANPKHTYAAPGAYDVRLIATSNYGFTSTFDSTVNVFEIPDADFIATNVCEGSPNSFVDASLLPSVGSPVYSWDFGDGNLGGNVSNLNHQYATPGTYVVNLTVDVNGCSDSKSRYVTLAPRAVPSFTAATSCNNRKVSFDNTSSLAFGEFGSLWKFGDGNSTSAPNPQHRYASFGTVDVTLITTTELGCVDSVTQQVSLIESPNADFSLSSYCSEEVAQVNNLTNTPTPGSNSYVWDFGNGQTSNLDNPVVQYTSPGTYMVSLMVFHTNGCADTLIRTVKVDAKPHADF